MPQPAVSGQPAASSVVMSPVPGAVAEIACGEGQRVEKGVVLFKLDSRLADAAVSRARQALAFAQQTSERLRQLAGEGGGALKNLQEAEAQRNLAQADLDAALTQQALLQIHAPLSATVVRLGVKPGQVVDLTTVLAELVDLDHLVVSATVPATELSQVKVGQAADLYSDANRRPAAPSTLPATSPAADAGFASGAVAFLHPVVDQKTGLGSVLVSVPAEAHLTPGQFLGLRVLTAEHPDRLAVPVDSLVQSEDGHDAVFIVNGEHAVQKPVRAGLRDAGFVEVEGEGISEGQAVVTVGAYGLPKESKIHVVTPASAEAPARD
jgi:RND family efflux transporter MFP subunit